jgi:hydroxyacylglutathione hydrolase
MKQWITHSGYAIYRVLAGRSNVFLVSNKTCNLLVDTGPAFVRKKLSGQLTKLGISHVDILLLTHSHFDHAANAHFLKKRYNPQVIIHCSEKESLLEGKNPIPTGTFFITRLLTSLASKSDRINRYLQFTGLEADRVFEHKYDLTDFGMNLYIIHTPGHTGGSSSLIVDNEIALVGDAMFGVFPKSVYPPFALDKNELIRSWKLLLETGCKLFLPSHGQHRARTLLMQEYEKYARKYL